MRTLHENTARARADAKVRAGPFEAFASWRRPGSGSKPWSRDGLRFLFLGIAVEISDVEHETVLQQEYSEFISMRSSCEFYSLF